jgi:hypothetical protein
MNAIISEEKDPNGRLRVREVMVGKDDAAGEQKNDRTSGIRRVQNPRSMEVSIELLPESVFSNVSPTSPTTTRTRLIHGEMVWSGDSSNLQMRLFPSS